MMMERAAGSSHSLNRQQAENGVPETLIDAAKLKNAFSIPLPLEGSKLPIIDPLEPFQSSSQEDGSQTIFHASESGYDNNDFLQSFIAFNNYNCFSNQFTTLFHNQFPSSESFDSQFPLGIPLSYEDLLAYPFKPTTESAIQFTDFSFASFDNLNNVFPSLHISDMASDSDFTTLVVGDAPPKNAAFQHPSASSENGTFSRTSTPLRQRY